LTEINQEKTTKRNKRGTEVLPFKEWRSSDELRVAFESFSDPDIHRLRMAAKSLGLLDSSWSIDDLINEAIMDALNGNRKCRDDMKVIPFLIGAMRSILYKKRSKRHRDPIGFQTTKEDQQNIGELKSTNLSPEQELEKIQEPDPIELNKRRAEEIEQLFKGDDDALWILEGIKDGLPAEEIRKISEMSKKTYDTTRKRIRRKTQQQIT
jgi:DNA-directed RNA polymerase specialized sigma24 family protein